MLHDITIRNQAGYTELEFWRLALGTFCNALSRMSISGGLQIGITGRSKIMNFQPRGISDQTIQGPASYASAITAAKALLETQPTWNGVTAEAVARMDSLDSVSLK